MKIPTRSFNLPSAPSEDMQRVAQRARRAADGVTCAAQPSAPSLKDGFDQTRGLRERALAVVTSDGAWAKSIQVDSGAQRPFHVRYGTTLPTLTQASRSVGGLPDGVFAGARGRVMGGASPETLSVALGAEGQLGVVAEGESSGQQGPYTISSAGEAFLGASSRGGVELGVLGASAAAESFVGASVWGSQTCGPDVPTTIEVQAQVGFRAAARGELGPLGFSGQQRMELGVRARALLTEDFTLIGPIGQRLSLGGSVFAGMTEGASAQAGLTGLSARGEYFAGAKATAEAGVALTAAGYELVGATGSAEVWAGIGATGEAGVGFDSDAKTMKLKVKGGVAVGLGGSVNVGLTVGAGDLVQLAGASAALGDGTKR